MVNRIYLLSMLLFFTSCNGGEDIADNEQDSISQIVKELKSGVSQKEKSIKELDLNLSMKKDKKNTQIEKSIFQEIGIELSDTKLIIDINKTNNFFGTLEKRLENHAHKIEKKIETKIKKIEDINMTDEIGIDIHDEELKIDLNKTKNMLDNISHLFESILFESNSSRF